MVRAKTKKGTKVWVNVLSDVEPNLGGFYCEIHINMFGDRFDDFCIHPEDCDCKNEKEVIAFIRGYISNINEY